MSEDGGDKVRDVESEAGHGSLFRCSLTYFLCSDVSMDQRVCLSKDVNDRRDGGGVNSCGIGLIRAMRSDTAEESGQGGSRR